MTPVSEKIGEGAEYGWEILVWGQFAEGLAGLIVGIILSIIAIMMIKGGIKILKENKGQHDWGKSEVYIVLLIIGTISAIIGLTIISCSLIAVIAPGYAAVKFLLTVAS